MIEELRVATGDIFDDDVSFFIAGSEERVYLQLGERVDR